MAENTINSEKCVGKLPVVESPYNYYKSYSVIKGDWSKDEDNRLRGCKYLGMSTMEIAKTHDRSHTDVLIRLHFLGLL